jgi:hypothetical protein
MQGGVCSVGLALGAQPLALHALPRPESGLASVLVLVLGLPAFDHAAMRSAIGRIVVSCSERLAGVAQVALTDAFAVLDQKAITYRHHVLHRKHPGGAYGPENHVAI